jgi:hypothetical protein
MEWVIRQNATAIGVGSAVDIVAGRLEHLVERQPNNPRLLLSEALYYARLLRGWVKENQPAFTLRNEPLDGARPGGKPGPMSDG